MVEKKGFKYLIDACALLRDRGVDFELEIIGERGEQSQLIEESIQRQGLSGHIKLLPPLPQRALTAHYQSARAFVLPCIILDDGDRDGIPNVMAEAMACAVPVVVTGISGIPEIVENRIHGLIVPTREAESLADALQQLLFDPQLARQLGISGRRRIEAVFDAKATHRNLKVLFDDVLASAT
jgi:glycosyltransferase involved in cell wall biosynthesis